MSHAARTSSRPARVLCVVTAAAALVALPAGCASPPRGPYEPMSEGRRNPLEAQRLTAEAAEYLERDPAKAERLLREALNHDLYHGPAHNNLGVLYLARGELYAAAGEFEWARKLMPGHPDPRLNLALTLEEAGRYTEALEGYRAALEVMPAYIPAQQALARLQLRHRMEDPDTRRLLEDIALRGEDDSWRNWARERLAMTAAR